MAYKKQFLFFILCLVFVSTVFAQKSDIAGKYEGTVDSQPFGKLNITTKIQHKEDKLSGIFHTPLGDAEIIEGSLSEGQFTLKIDAGGDDLILVGKRSKDGILSGTISGETVKGSFVLNRVGDLEQEKGYSIVLRQSKEKWRDDLKFLSEELPKRHKNAFHRISRSEFEKLIKNLDTKISSLTDDEIIWEMIRLVSRIGDGHTGLGAIWSYAKVPIKLFWFGNELRIVRVSKEFSRMNGARLVKINDVPVERIYEQSRNYIPQAKNEKSVAKSDYKSDRRNRLYNIKTVPGNQKFLCLQ